MSRLTGAFDVLGSPGGLQLLDGFTTKLIRLAHVAFTLKNMQSHFRIFTTFCPDLGLNRPIREQVHIMLRHIGLRIRRRYTYRAKFR